MQNAGGTNPGGEPVPVVAGEDARVAPPPVTETAGGPAGDIRPPTAEAGKTVEVPVQAGDEGQSGAVAKARVEVAGTEMPPGEKVSPDELLTVVGADSKQTARDAVDESLGGDHGGLEDAVSVTPDPDEGEQPIKPTAVEVKAPEVAEPVVLPPKRITEPTPPPPEVAPNAAPVVEAYPRPENKREEDTILAQIADLVDRRRALEAENDEARKGIDSQIDELFDQYRQIAKNPGSAQTEQGPTAIGGTA